MATLQENAKLNVFPKDFILALKNLFENTSEYYILRNQLVVTGVMLQYKNFQLSISNVEELDSIKETLDTVSIDVFQE